MESAFVIMVSCLILGAANFYLVQIEIKYGIRYLMFANAKNLYHGCLANAVILNNVV